MKKLSYYITLVFILVFSSGCFSYHYTEKLTDAELKTIQGNTLSNLVVEVKPSQNSQVFINDLNKTLLFKEVNYKNKLKHKPNLVIEVKEAYAYLNFRCANPYILNMLTFWILPAWWDNAYGYNIEISTEKKDNIHLKHKQNTLIIGSFFASCFNLFPNWYSEPPKRKVHINKLKLYLIENQNKLKECTINENSRR